MMSKGYNPNGPHLNKKTIVHTEKNSWMFREFVSEEALFAVLDVKYIISLNISTHSAKPTFILRKSKGNSCSQTCMIFRTGYALKTSESYICIIIW